jgi:hypothetical protein
VQAVKIDLSIVSQIVGGLVLLIAGAGINRFFERRARLVVFYGHVGQFHPQLEQQGIVRTHAVVIRNVQGGKTREQHGRNFLRYAASKISGHCVLSLFSAYRGRADQRADLF